MYPAKTESAGNLGFPLFWHPEKLSLHASHTACWLYNLSLLERTLAPFPQHYLTGSQTGNLGNRVRYLKSHFQNSIAVLGTVLWNIPKVWWGRFLYIKTNSDIYNIPKYPLCWRSIEALYLSGILWLSQSAQELALRNCINHPGNDRRETLYLCSVFWMQELWVGYLRGRGRKGKGSKSKTFLWPKYHVSLWQLLFVRDHTHTPLWEWAAPVRSSPEIQTYLELPLMARNTKEQFCFSYTCGPYATDINVREAFLAPWMFLVPQFVWDPKMDSVCTPEPKWSLSDLVKSSDIW